MIAAESIPLNMENHNNEARTTIEPTALYFCRNDLIADARSIRDVVSNIEAFFTEQLQRLERAIAMNSESNEREMALTQRVAVMEEERKTWEHVRDKEIERLRKEGNRLATSWAELEAEQRRRLGAKDLSQPSVADANTPDSLPIDRERYSHESPNLGNEIPGMTETELSEHGTDTTRPTREESVRQFHQLRREIGKHNQGNR